MVEAETQSGPARVPADQRGPEGGCERPEALKRIWDRAEACEDWGERDGAGIDLALGPVGMLVKESMRASGRAGSDRVREILDRARQEMEEL